MNITILYAGILSILYGALALLVVYLRNQCQHLYTASETENMQLKRTIRGHANLAEYVPYILLLMFFAESRNTNAWVIHALGVTLVVARVIHAYTFTRDHEILPLRATATVLTLTTLFVSGIYCISLGLS